MATSGGSLSVQSLHRALTILETVGNHPAPITLRQLTEKTELPKPTVYRLLRNLEDRSYVSCDSNGHYRLGTQFLTLSRWAERDFEIKQLARKHLEYLNELSKETVHLAILDQQRVLYIDTVESPHALRLVAKLGSTNSVHCTALGKALLIHYPDVKIKEILEAHGMERRTAYTLTTPEAYLQEMAQVRRCGYALDDRESELDGRCVGAPIFDQNGTAIAAISISGLSTRFSREHIENNIVSSLLERTALLSKILGHTEKGPETLP